MTTDHQTLTSSDLRNICFAANSNAKVEARSDVSSSGMLARLAPERR